MSRLNSRVQSQQYGGVNNAGRMRKLAPPVILIKGPARGLEHTDDRALDAVQQRANDATQQTASGPLAGAVFIQGQSFVSGQAVSIAHGLGRVFVSAMLSGCQAPVVSLTPPLNIPNCFSVQRPAAVRRPPTAQNALDAAYVVIIPYFTGTADVLVW